MKTIIAILLLMAACTSPDKPRDDYAEFNVPPPVIEPTPAPKKIKTKALKIKKKSVKINPDGK